MPTTIGGKPIVFDDGGKVSRFMEDYQPLRHLKDFYHGYHEPSDRGSREGGKLRVGMSLDSWNDAPNIGLNELYWPTGASRFTLGYFLMRGADVATLPDPFTEPVPCRFEAVNTLLTNLYVGYRRITTTDDLFLVVLVDERFFWQSINIGDMIVNEDTTWESLFSLTGAKIGGVAVDPIDEDYLSPDPGELSRPYAMFGPYLDSLAHSVGHRIVRLVDGTVKSMGQTSSDLAYGENTGRGGIIAGGMMTQAPPQGNGDPPETPTLDIECSHPIPSSVDVVFQGSENGFACCSDPYVSNQECPTFLKPVNSKGETESEEGDEVYVKTIYSTAYADYTTNGAGGVPDNESELNLLAIRISLDYYARFYRQSYDVTFQGIPQWSIGGYDDSILFRFGIPSKSGEKPDWIVNTRIQSLRPNGEPYTNLSQDPEIKVLKCGFYAAKVTEEITAAVDGVPGEGKVEVYELNKSSGNLINTDIEVTVFNLTGTVFEGPDEIEETEGEWIYINVDGFCTPWVVSLGNTYYTYADGGIPARNDTTKAFGSSSALTLWKLKSDGTYVETSITNAVVRNWSLTEVEDGAFTRVKVENGLYVVDNADCEAPPEEE